MRADTDIETTTIDDDDDGGAFQAIGIERIDADSAIAIAIAIATVVVVAGRDVKVDRVSDTDADTDNVVTCADIIINTGVVDIDGVDDCEAGRGGRRAQLRRRRSAPARLVPQTNTHDIRRYPFDDDCLRFLCCDARRLYFCLFQRIDVRVGAAILAPFRRTRLRCCCRFDASRAICLFVWSVGDELSFGSCSFLLFQGKPVGTYDEQACFFPDLILTPLTRNIFQLHVSHIAEISR